MQEIATQQVDECPRVAARKSALSGIIDSLDGRRKSARRLRVLAHDIEAQLKQPITDQQRALVKRTSELVLACEIAREKLLAGEFGVALVAEIVRLENICIRSYRDLHGRSAPVAPARVTMPSLSELLKQART